ncbi:hypothetical protein PPTG_02708 [Phytophthora nicotianae INRA-310]|uniref:Uncharacterized protein n=1 Tax=Phytophthora nicotianae (strain INRA-310) TaxID=761204 RepID=W2RE60_PHYN3|nr:hypothetical protein PPTG_02708 [Phytophthora nicotianae INRA-310]ETN22974.1 hypothetical protein PPTG_02708 [Phytophthora nicotianae INRA-310]
MSPPNKRKKHARNFKRKADGSIYKLKLNKNLPSRPPSTEGALASTATNQRGTGLFASTQARRGREQEMYDVERNYANRWKNLPWKLKVDFELEAIDLVWLYQPTQEEATYTPQRTHNKSVSLIG